MSLPIPFAVKCTIGALALYLVNEVFRVTVQFPSLAADLEASSFAAIEPLAVVLGVIALVLVLQRSAWGRWLSVATLALAYVHHLMTWLSSLHAGDEQEMAQQAGATLYEALLFLCCISLLANLAFSGSVRAFFASAPAPADAA